MTRKRSEKFIPIKVIPEQGKLVERVRYLREWRKQHEQLAVMTGPTRGLGLALGEKWEWEGGWIWRRRLRRLMRLLSGLMFWMLALVSAFLFSSFHTLIWVPYTEGAEIWVTAENAYNERVSRVQNQILARLRHLARRGMQRRCLEFSQSGQRYVLSLPIVIFLLNDTHVDSWCDTGVPDSTNRFGNGGH